MTKPSTSWRGLAVITSCLSHLLLPEYGLAEGRPNIVAPQGGVSIYTAPPRVHSIDLSGWTCRHRPFPQPEDSNPLLPSASPHQVQVHSLQTPPSAVGSAVGTVRPLQLFPPIFFTGPGANNIQPPSQTLRPMSAQPVTIPRPASQVPQRLSVLPASLQMPLVNRVQTARQSATSQSLCGSRVSYSASSPSSVADGRYRWLNQQLNCNSKLPTVTAVSLVDKLPDGMCCVFDGNWERNGGYLVNGQNYYTNANDPSGLRNAQSACNRRGGRWFTWMNDILTNTAPGDLFPYARKHKTEQGEIWEPVDYSGYNGAKWLATTNAQCPTRTVSPLIVDFSGSGVPLSNQRDGVFFDLTASGSKQRISWPLDNQSMFLVLDNRTSGQSADLAVDGNSLFGNYSKGPDGKFSDNGFLALAKYDSNADAKVDASDQVFKQLRLWSDTNRDGVAQSNELMSLDVAGVRDISLEHRPIDDSDEFGNSKVQVGVLTMTTGAVHKIYDVWFAVGGGSIYGGLTKTTPLVAALTDLFSPRWLADLSEYRNH